ncbi:MAG: formate dehydrogenase subunit delta [Proteobacteria bacterium]|nr:formate dehydrogenase subunit delta [Pseudomonadota bacterium]
MNQRETLVMMANQIARNFATMSETEAAKATANHIALFWDPRMKAMILDQSDGLTPPAAAAIDLLRNGDPPAL